MDINKKDQLGTVKYMNDTYSLDERLLTIASFVRKNKVFADIGTDHGYIPVYLAGNGICPSGYACDINALPLKKAENNIKGHSLESKIKPLLCDGLDALKGGVDDIIIAGMGGDTIIHILSSAPWVKNENIHFILQPMTKIEKLREYLYEQGFYIEEEQAVESGRFVYTVMSIFFDGQKKEITTPFYYGGKLLEKKDKLSIRYIEHVIFVLQKKAQGQASSKLGVYGAADTLETIELLEQELCTMKGELCNEGKRDLPEN